MTVRSALAVFFVLVVSLTAGCGGGGGAVGGPAAITPVSQSGFVPADPAGITPFYRGEVAVYPQDGAVGVTRDVTGPRFNPAFGSPYDAIARVEIFPVDRPNQREELGRYPQLNGVPEGTVIYQRYPAFVDGAGREYRWEGFDQDGRIILTGSWTYTTE